MVRVKIDFIALAEGAELRIKCSKDEATRLQLKQNVQSRCLNWIKKNGLALKTKTEKFENGFSIKMIQR